MSTVILSFSIAALAIGGGVLLGLLSAWMWSYNFSDSAKAQTVKNTLKQLKPTIKVLIFVMITVIIFVFVGSSAISYLAN
jgi:uncharacterized membrane protein YidH (DUF202 family)